MISKKLISQVPDAIVHIKKSVLLQLVSLIANISIMFTLGQILQLVFTGSSITGINRSMILILFSIGIRFLCTVIASKESYEASKTVKLVLREKIYTKMLNIGTRYTQKLSTAEVLQVTGEGVDQLEIYFGSYLPQFFYAMIAPIILFVVVSTVSLKTAIILFLCVPMIPISIVAVQKFAKKLLAKYWGEYTGLGDNFLENLQGLNTLKIYNADQKKHEEMNIQAERFRKITMRVLTMQLNSISVMDIIAYGGTALGIIISLLEYNKGNITLGSSFMIILLCSDFFLPMRLLGSYFHVAMNGMAASKKIFTLLEMEEDLQGDGVITETNITINNLQFTYPDKDKKAIKGINISIQDSGFYAIVGESGCGKSTVAGILSGHLRGYEGSLTFGKQELQQVSHENILKAITVVGLGSYLFKGSIRENLLMADSEATDVRLWEVLKQVNLSEYIKQIGGLDAQLTERGSNLSGGQCQRLALARALLHDTPIYIFDEATSNIDVESEMQIMKVIKELSTKKTVIVISHRLANVTQAKQIFVLNQGKLKEEGTHQDLLSEEGTYAQLWNAQWELENLEKGEHHEK